MAEDYPGVLKQARQQLIAQRRGLANALAEPYQSGRTEELMEKFRQLQDAIEAIDAASEDEEDEGGGEDEDNKAKAPRTGKASQNAPTIR
jgi:hypothetical protein